MLAPGDTQVVAVVEQPRPTRYRRGRAPNFRLGVLGAVLLFVGLAVLSSLAVPPFRSADESAHGGYALAIAHGRIPSQYERVPAQIPGQRQPTHVYTTVHPPLYHALIAGPLLLGIEVGKPLLGLHLARIESALFSAVTVALTAVLAGMLLGRRRTEAVVAAATMATLGIFVLSSSLVYNDSLATLLSVAVLLGTLAVLRQGLRTSGCVLLILAAAASMAVRASNAEVVAMAGIGLLAAGAIHARNRWIGVAQGIGWSAAMGVACFAAAGWFYLLNQARYGHLTGWVSIAYDPHSPMYDAHGYPYPGGGLSFLLSPDSYLRLARDTYGDLLGVDRVLPWSNPVTVAGLVVVWSLAALGALWWLRQRRRLGPTRARQALVALVALHGVACLLYVAWWVQAGGYPHIRYLFPALPVVAVILARAVVGLPGGRWWAVLVVTVQLVLALGYLAKLPAQWTGESIWGVYPAALGKAGVPLPALVTVGLLLIVICGWLLCARAILTRQPTRSMISSETS
ncbi:MAG: hypothetical protein GEV03_12495 [Streptosporangiales bacterium]|nr:hypothetical protein [Streptosporangiales bacterium]